MLVMRRWTISTVENLIISDKERDNDIRKRTAYCAFLSRYCIEFQKFDSVQQQNIIGVPNNIGDDKEEEDDDNGDSTIPPTLYCTMI